MSSLPYLVVVEWDDQGAQGGVDTAGQLRTDPRPWVLVEVISPHLLIQLTTRARKSVSVNYFFILSAAIHMQIGAVRTSGSSTYVMVPFRQYARRSQDVNCHLLPKIREIIWHLRGRKSHFSCSADCHRYQKKGTVWCRMRKFYFLQMECE